MTNPAVTDFVAHYDQPAGDSWAETRADWNSHATAAWVRAAEERGLTVTVQEICSPDVVGGPVAHVEVDGQEYAITHLGRAMELQAKPR
ncbi:hypothetical protein AB0C65_38330 [Nocardia sp. NPDC048505]|uniref:hypothetical protein n=1 Tax=Nocardia sp. NPDC048505 TaxID=3155756 RepID=UPI0033E85FE0